MRLFLKLFISFWGTLLLMGVLVAWTGYQIRGHVETLFHQRLAKLQGEQRELGDILKSQGLLALKTSLETHPHKKFLFVLDPEKKELLGRVVSPRQLKHLFHRQQHHTQTENSHPENVRLHPRRWFARHPLVVQSADGILFRIVISPPKPHFFSLLIDHRPLMFLTLMGFGSLIGLSGLMVFLLARHFSKPILLLRKKTMMLAEGDLSARATLTPNRIPDELNGLAQDFNFMADRLEKLFNAQKRLLRDVSHELRSPLARMRAGLGLLENQSMQENPYHLRLNDEIERLNTLIGQIITLSRPEQSVTLPTDSWVDLGYLVHTVVVDATFESQQSNRKLLLKGNTPILLRADGQRLHSAVENVVRNALHHTPKGGTIQLNLTQTKTSVTLTVIDQGPGVPEEQLSNLFIPFFRVDEARDQKSGGFGFGLGLAIAAQAIEDHKGTITAANRPDGGFMITMQLPLEKERPLLDDEKIE